MLILNEVAVAERVEAFSTQVSAGQQVHIVGANGAGKSSLLARIAGLLQGTGEVIIDKQPQQKMSNATLARVRGFLCQQQQPCLLMPVFQYIALHQPKKVSTASLSDVVTYLCENLDLNDKLSTDINRLSGGEWQRVRLAAILLQVWPTINADSRLLLLDEPTTSLDVNHQLALRRLLNEWCDAGGALITSSHDLNHSMNHANAVWLMKKGKVIAQGPPDTTLTIDQLQQMFGAEFQLHTLGTEKVILLR